MKKQIYFLFLIFPFSFLIVQAQVKPKFKKTIRGEVELPREFSNKAFRQTFSGLINAGASMNFGYHNFNTGIFGSLTEFQIVKKFTGDPHSIQTTYTGGLKFSYDMLTSTGKGMFSPYIAPGYSFIKYTELTYITTPPIKTNYYGLSLNFGITYNMMLIDDWTGVGFVLGYSLVDHVYDPFLLSQNQIYPNYTDNRGDLQNFFFGFCVYFDLARPHDAGDE
jgi:hypothetical protein